MARSSQKKTDDKFTQAEAQQRFEAALRGARIAVPKPMTGDDAKKPPRLQRQPVGRISEA
jgi:hypothetical protein